MARLSFNAQDLPFDILPPILAQLIDRRDWHACALASKTFNRVATPLLYSTLDSRILSKVTEIYLINTFTLTFNSTSPSSSIHPPLSSKDLNSRNTCGMSPKQASLHPIPTSL
jgi:hypothetical protein